MIGLWKTRCGLEARVVRQNPDGTWGGYVYVLSHKIPSTWTIDGDSEETDLDLAKKIAGPEIYTGE